MTQARQTPGMPWQGKVPIVVSDAVVQPVSGLQNGVLLPGAQSGVQLANGKTVVQTLLDRSYDPIRFKPSGDVDEKAAKARPPFKLIRPEKPTPAIRSLPGTHVFARYLFDHYGHFLLESLSTLWFLKQYPDLPLVWVPACSLTALRPWQTRILRLLGLRNPVRIVTEPTRVDRLIVPQPGFVIQTYFSRAQADALAAVAARPVTPGKKIWLSRSRMKTGRVDNEKMLEFLLQRAGWQVVHPEDHPLDEQLDWFVDAERIAGIAGSALHTLLLFREIGARVDIFARGPLISRNFITIADRLGLDQHVHYARMVSTTPGVPSYEANWSWVSLDPVLSALGVRRPVFRPNRPLRSLAVRLAVIAGRRTGGHAIALGAVNREFLEALKDLKTAVADDRRPASLPQADGALRRFDLSPELYLARCKPSAKASFILLDERMPPARLKALIDRAAPLALDDALWILPVTATDVQPHAAVFAHAFDGAPRWHPHGDGDTAGSPQGLLIAGRDLDAAPVADMLSAIDIRPLPATLPAR